MTKTAVVLFNLGGPDRPQSVRPFLFNLFSDPAIISLPALLRWPLAAAVAARRAPVARDIYAHLGGGSPLVANTQAQAESLEQALGGERAGYRVFVAMRYWHPMSDATAAAVKAFAPDRIVLLPLYPQFSTTTTGSSLTAWRRAARRVGLAAPTGAVCCYPTAAGFIAALATRARQGLIKAAKRGYDRPRVLFSAHGLPCRVLARGDPYRWQVERTAAAVAAHLGEAAPAPGGLDWVVCYQSRVGPMEWIGPATDDEIRRAGAEGRALVVVPVAFVSEHSETLVELDIEYGKLAKEAGVPAYVRVPTVDAAESFIAALATLVREAQSGAGAVEPGAGESRCPESLAACPCVGATRRAESR